MKSAFLPSLTVVFLLAACAAGAEEAVPEKAPDPPMGRVTFPSGRTFLVELALTAEEQARGYMWRQEIRSDEGMLFLYDRPGVYRFWMKNCLVPIDMIWLDGEDRVLAIEHSAPPCHDPQCPSFGPFMTSHAVLEIRGGVAEEEGLKPGDRLEILTDIPGR
jgi:uncharacterized membrane protein (UPF0127 family)